MMGLESNWKAVDSSEMSEPNLTAASDQEDKKQPKINYNKLYDKLFAPPPPQKNEQHKSFRYIPKFSSKQQPLSDLEDKLRADVSIIPLLCIISYF